MRAVKQLTRERIAAGSCMLAVELSPNALDTRWTGEAVTVPLETAGPTTVITIVIASRLSSALT